MNKKTKTLTALVVLPFLITALERYLIKPAALAFPLPVTSINLLKYISIILLVFCFIAFTGKNYGIKITRKLRAPLAVMFLALLAASYLFLYSLKTKGFFDDFAAIHLANWLLAVFREEFILRGVIQSEASTILKGKFLNLSYPVWFSTVMFSLWHLVNLATVPWPTVALEMLASLPSGFVLGFIREKTDNTLLTYLLHVTGDLLFFSFYTLILSQLFFTLF